MKWNGNANEMKWNAINWIGTFIWHEIKETYVLRREVEKWDTENMIKTKLRY